jgi:TonB-dependent receptor
MKKNLIDTGKISLPISRFYCFFLLLMISTMSGFGQEMIKGIIADTEDNAPLVAATVVLKGTTIGTVTDYNGEYTLPVKPGTYTLEISYLGYDTKEVPITVEENQTLVVNESLSLSTFTGEVIIVTAQARGQLGAMNQQIKSNQIVNVVSAERIRELPDENAAQAISRLPGVHLDGSKVVIRGVDAKMNKILVNGIVLPSTESNNRATDLGIVSANMLSGIEVYKSLTPDMDADAIGGVVNLRLREAQKGFHAALTAQGGYNWQEDLLGRKLLWGDVSNRFFNGKLGVLLNVNYEVKSGGDDRVQIGYAVGSDRTPSSDPDKEYWRLNSVNVYDQLSTVKNAGGALVIDYDFLHGQLIYSGMLNHSLNTETVYRDEMTMNVKYRRFYIDPREYTSLLLNNSLRLEQQFGRVKFDATIANTSIDRKDNYNYNIRFSENSQYPAFNNLVSDISFLDHMAPTDIYETLITHDSVMSEFKMYTGDRTPVVYDEKQWIGDLNLEMPLNISDYLNINFKVGGKYLRKERNYDENDYFFGDNSIIRRPLFISINPWLQSFIPEYDANTSTIIYFPDFRDMDYRVNDRYISGYSLDYVIDQEKTDEMMLRQMDLDLMEINSTQYWHDYWGFETRTAAYAMAEINIGNRLLLIPGIRYENVHNEYSAYLTYQGSTNNWGLEDTITRPTDHPNWLPHLHGRLHVTDWLDIRASYNKTLSRPDYNYAVPKMHYDLGQSQPTAGNPLIKPAVSTNYDLNIMFHADKLGLITIGGYIKEIDDVFYLKQSQLKNIPDTFLVDHFPVDAYPSMLTQVFDYYVNNQYTGYLKGLELEWQSNLSWLPRPFNGIVLNANYTHVWSETKYPVYGQKDSLVQIGPIRVPIKVQHDTFFVERLINQANDIANVSLGYDYGGFSARISFRFQGNVIRQIDRSSQKNEYTHDIYSYDLVVKQRIPLEFADLEVFLNAINITNVPVEKRYRNIHYIGDYWYTNNNGERYDGKSDTYLRYRGPQFQLGIRMKI